MQKTFQRAILSRWYNPLLPFRRTISRTKTLQNESFDKTNSLNTQTTANNIASKGTLTEDASALIVGREHRVFQDAIENFSNTTEQKENSYEQSLSEIAGYENEINQAIAEDEKSAFEATFPSPDTETPLLSETTTINNESSTQVEHLRDLFDPLTTSSPGSSIFQRKPDLKQIKKYDINLSSYLKEDSEKNAINRFQAVSKGPSVSSVLDLGLQLEKKSDSELVDEGMLKYKEGIIKAKQQEEKLEQLLNPVLANIDKNIDDDNDLLTVISKYIISLRKYLSQDHSVGQNHRGESQSAIPDPLSPDLSIPQPVQISVPFIIKNLLMSEKYDFVGQDRKYVILSWVHNVCKNYHKDINLYLSVFTIDLYNYLLDLTWMEFKNISSVYQIVTEMRANGVKGDIETIKILENIDAEIEKNQMLLSGRFLEEPNDDSPIPVFGGSRVGTFPSQPVRGMRLIRSMAQVQQRSKLQHHTSMLKNMLF
ncbi:hypothetical protein ACO0QE_000222 [Hanseniaspora vineae]